MVDNSKATIWYMDGEQALYYDERKPAANEDREGMIEVLLVPSDLMKAKYNIDDAMLNIDMGDGRLGMWVEYKEECLHWITRGVAWPRLVILCGFDGSPTRFQDFVDEKNMFYLINNLKQRNWRLQMLVNEKDKIINMLSNDKNEYIRSLVDLDKLKGLASKNDYQDEEEK